MTSRRAALWLATWGGCGYVKGAPGTAGSAVAVGLAYGLVQLFGLPTLGLALLAVVLFWPAAEVATQAEQHFGRRDPPEVVVDEVIGQWLALAAVNPSATRDWIAGFLLFRLFDIVKPFPVRRLERLPRGWGVVADDAAAGLCAMIILLGLHELSFW